MRTFNHKQLLATAPQVRAIATGTSRTYNADMDGILIIDKPAGLTSHDVVDQVRRILRVRRVGHTGTLDPFATGVLVVMVGRATRLAQFLSAVEKEYEAVIRLGYATDTGDRTGKRISDDSDSAHGGRAGGLSDQEIETALAGLRGEIDQVPPMYSAKKQAGRKLYELARRGEEVERPAVRVNIHEFEAVRNGEELIKDNGDGTFDILARVVCSTGTYVRTLAEDFGRGVKTGAHLAELRRTRVGDFHIDSAHTLQQLQDAVADEAIGTLLRSPDEALGRLPAVDLSSDDIRRVRNGVAVRSGALSLNCEDGELVRMRDEVGNHLIAVGRYDGAGQTLHPIVVISLEN